MPSSTGLRLTTVTIGAPEPRVLGRFYQQLLGWTLDGDHPEWVTLRNPDGDIGLAFNLEERYEPPIWPAEVGSQQMMLHLEIQVDDLQAAVGHAVQCGAVLADFQPQQDVRVCLDPVGHPFCLYVAG